MFWPNIGFKLVMVNCETEQLVFTYQMVSAFYFGGNWLHMSLCPLKEVSSHYLVIYLV